ncbi:uncharacterized protein LOC107766742 isoform X2 [Nicotiana tabacum]|uniref:Uncharacterized protein LOC107766742 isoform X2 n=1 Tax=Nicotiana tabacum TaxID=4097 RepID=A0AC58U3I5_TOBAC
MIDMAWLSAIILGAGCLALGYIIGVRHSSRTSLSNKASGGTETLVDGKKKKGVKPPLEVERLAEILEDFKMVLVVRNDLKMGKGKIAAQCSHATLGLYKKLHNRAPKALNRWEMCGQVKVVVKIEREEDMLLLQVPIDRSRALQVGYQLSARCWCAPFASELLVWKGQNHLIYQHILQLMLGEHKLRQVLSFLPSHAAELYVKMRHLDHHRLDSRTVMAVLGPADLVDDITGGLKLL